MTRDWNDIKWIFEPDGSLLDIYVQDISVTDWEKLIDLLNHNHTLIYGPTEGDKMSDKIDKDYVLKYLTNETDEMECKFTTIDLAGIKVNCNFFLPDQIEFDIDPKEINSIEDFEKVELFMEAISQELKNQVTLTGENSIEFPLAKVDTAKGIKKVLTKKEARELRSNPNSFINQFNLAKATIEMNLFPEKFEKKLMDSANEIYKSTSKDKNVW